MKKNEKEGKREKIKIKKSEEEGTYTHVINFSKSYLQKN